MKFPQSRVYSFWMSTENGNIHTGKERSFILSEQLYQYCLDAAQKEGVTPTQVLKEMLRIGESVLKITDSTRQHEVILLEKPDGSEFEIRVERK